MCQVNLLRGHDCLLSELPSCPQIYLGFLGLLLFNYFSLYLLSYLPSIESSFCQLLAFCYPSLLRYQHDTLVRASRRASVDDPGSFSHRHSATSRSGRSPDGCLRHGLRGMENVHREVEFPSPRSVTRSPRWSGEKFSIM